MDRKQLISYAIYYEGDYFKIVKAILNNETINIDYDYNAITILDDNYPANLYSLKYPPFVLFYKGNINLLNKDMVAVVGSRKACDFAINSTKYLVNQLNREYVIISGLAKGIDTIAHIHAKETIGILGSGIDYIYPKSNYNLIKKMEENDLILSEYPSLTKPYPNHFPFRNRVIAALSSKIYIMQSHFKSGTMTTVKEGLELGKEIRVLPYNLFDQNGITNNILISEGADIILNEEIAF